MGETPIGKPAWAECVALGFAGSAVVLIGWAAFRGKRGRALAEARADTAKTALLTTVAHELQIPITSIRGLSTLLLDTLPPSGEAADYAGRIARNSEALANLVADLLAFSRLGEGDLSLATDAVDVSSLVPSVLDQLATVTGQHRLRLEVEPGVTVKGDADALTRILTNLVGNAVKFSPSGSEIVVTVRTDGGAGALSVMDEGPGIHEVDRDHVFERFYRGSRPGTDRPRGMGIGLAVVRDLTDCMGGTVEVTRGEQGGARFTVQLPLVAPQP